MAGSKDESANWRHRKDALYLYLFSCFWQLDNQLMVQLRHILSDTYSVVEWFVIGAIKRRAIARIASTERRVSLSSE